ncbi:hypothetical protein GLOIN_2v1886123 [Rhizophagus irregularis DAOM 181602=DAOM 197198]|uniref:Uncharacterized protein n=1 Tax=Rhizophagus irregularis (strain DAOM 181602 / DAOM 197198 / MUCL 43194) TaxID=747089 RepID=A0A2P4NY42_RHIID|nr:hypothetical protein GLOIN_2v1886123 [Rhizophagus irregularis DAOM 181602=DAOM 197198]POG58054.1 hypothetical protein GLOIN_2v1886123 [Rhizophagus irregularis DAOM 181602=DAOM 197198]|eukprot:XP_025164920.1 hypothetical protein GLOIN_2v1886123 [Rhizophagus irregularis DAOM 181602=DAOM 197198]
MGETLSTSSNNSTKTNKLTTYKRFVIPTNKDLQAIQAYSHVTNTDDSTKTWMNLFNSYRETANFTNPLELLNDTTLQEQLCQFFCGVRKSGKKEYAPSSLHKRLHKIFDGRIKQIQDNQDTSRKKTDALEMCEIKTIFDSPNIQTDTPKSLTYRFIPASQLLRYDQLEIQSLEQDHKITQDSSKLPVINIENINIQNCNNIKVEVIVKPFE